MSEQNPVDELLAMLDVLVPRHQDRALARLLAGTLSELEAYRRADALATAIRQPEFCMFRRVQEVAEALALASLLSPIGGRLAGRVWLRPWKGEVALQ